MVEVYSFLKLAERKISGLPKLKYLLFSNLYHTSWVTKRKVVIMMKEENVEDEVMSRSTILNPDTGRQTEISPQVPVNSSQNSSLETLVSRFTILNPDKARLPEVSHQMQLSSSQENSSFNGGSSKIFGNS